MSVLVEYHGENIEYSLEVVVVVEIKVKYAGFILLAGGAATFARWSQSSSVSGFIGPTGSSLSSKQIHRSGVAHSLDVVSPTGLDGRCIRIVTGESLFLKVILTSDEGNML